MRKEDLKDGMILEMRNGKRFLLVNDVMRDLDNFIGLSSYNNDLTHTQYAHFDIVKVYKDTREYSLRSKFKDRNLTFIWEREPKIKLTDREIDILKVLKIFGYEWVARDKSDDLYVFIYKPTRQSNGVWFDEEDYFFPIKGKGKGLFNFIKWEDEEPINIDDLLKRV